MSRIGNYKIAKEYYMTYNEATDNYRNTMAQYGIESEQAKDAQIKMCIAWKAEKLTRTTKQKFINLICKIQWLLKRKKY